MPILYSYLVYSPTINTHTLRTIFLRYKNNWNKTRTQTFTYIPFSKEFTYLPLYLFGLLWISPVDWFGMGSLGMKSILCSIPLSGGKLLGISSEKKSSNSCKSTTKSLGKEGFVKLQDPLHISTRIVWLESKTFLASLDLKYKLKRNKSLLSYPYFPTITQPLKLVGSWMWLCL